VPGLRLSLVLLLSLCLALSVAGVGDGARSTPVRESAPVPSLEPEKTAALWSRLVSTRARRAQAPAQCRPLRAVFYAASDWMRLATKLAASASPCADYYISIPPIVADKTQPRPDQAWRIRALGPRFHAMAEIHFATWSRWVGTTGSSWHDAGVTARQRMAAAGYDVAQGDIWALNEAGSAIRRGEGDARANLREFLRGLYEGDGTRPTRGAVFVIGLGQRTADVSVYQSTVQGWLADSAFWSDMAAYVSDWSQQAYGDVRSHAVPGSPKEVRRDYLNDYLQHVLLLAGAGPPEIEAARSYVRDAYSPLANAAWERDSGYGWTMVPGELMQSYVSAQVYSLRHFSATSGQARDHWGFAWAPRNASGSPSAQFAAQTGALLDRLGSAVRDSGEQAIPEDPGSGACGLPGQSIWCAGDLAEARPTEAWKSFRTWSQPLLTFATPPQTLVAGTVSAPIGLRLVTSTGLPAPPRAPLAVTLGSSSASGTFSTSPTGPWVPTLTVTVAPDASTVEGVYYLDPVAGSHVLTASAPGTTSATQPVTVTAGPAARVAVSPATGSVRARGVLRFRATATDAFGNAVPASFAWRVVPAALGTVEATVADGAAFTAGRLVRQGRVVAVAGGSAGSAAASVAVLPGTLRIASVDNRRTATGARVTVRAVDGAGRPVPAAVLRVLVRSGGKLVSSSRVGTGPAGRALLRIQVRRGTCATTTVGHASAAGFRWDGRTPRSRVCR
jgi:hypothetical protein